MPLAIAVAVLRYRLWDLDRLISRTVAYALLTALLLGLGYAAVVLGLGRLLFEGSTLVVAAATLAVAAVFAPAPPGPGAGRPALQPAPLRRRPDPGGVRGQAVDQVDLDALNSELLAVVDQTMQPTRAPCGSGRPLTAHSPAVIG